MLLSGQRKQRSAACVLQVLQLTDVKEVTAVAVASLEATLGRIEAAQVCTGQCTVPVLPFLDVCLPPTVQGRHLPGAPGAQGRRSVAGQQELQQQQTTVDSLSR